MKEQDVPQQLSSYRDAIGRCDQIPARRTTRQRLLVLAPVGALAACVVGFFLWPRDAQAATLRRLGDAITNAKSMESHMYIIDPAGKWVEWTRTTCDEGRWRIDYLMNTSHAPMTVIFRDGLSFDDYSILDYATVRPSDVAMVPIPTRGQALDIIEAQLMNYPKGATLTLASSPPVNGRDAYRVLFDRNDEGRPLANRHIELVVDRDTDLPISADVKFGEPVDQHTHWDYRFNVPVADKQFELKPGRKIVDLRKTIPAFEAAHNKPLASLGDFQVLDACVSRDGTVWVATKVGRDSGPDEFWGVPGVHYTGGSGIVFEGKLSRKDNITVYGFTPLDKPTSLPTSCSMSIRQFTPSVPIPNSDSVTAGRVLGVVGKLTFPVRVEHTDLPSYAASFGAEDGLLGVQFNKQDAKAQAYESSHRYAEAARMYELIGIDCTPAYHAYLEWMQHASECYRNAGLTADALRVDAAMSRYRSTARP